MRKTTLHLIVALLLALGLATSAAAHNAGPCNESPEPGHSEFAQHHVVPATPGHVPGTHRGMSACNPSENRP